MTTKNYLISVLKKCNLKIDGVFAANMIPQMLKKKTQYAIIINTDPNTLPGEHWIVVIKTKNKKPFLYDSLSLPIFSFIPCLKKFLREISVKRIYKKPIQIITSNFCGFYCLHALLQHYLKTNEIKLDPFIIYEDNDMKCISNIEIMIKYIQNKK